VSVSPTGYGGQGPARWRRLGSAFVIELGGVPMSAAPGIVSDELWELIEPPLPKRQRSRPGGRSRHPDRQTLSRILFVPHTGIAWRHLPGEFGFGSRVTCRRRLDEWQRVGVWEQLHRLLLERLRVSRPDRVGASRC
jgi:transposase